MTATNYYACFTLEGKVDHGELRHRRQDVVFHCALAGRRRREHISET